MRRERSRASASLCVAAGVLLGMGPITGCTTGGSADGGAGSGLIDSAIAQSWSVGSSPPEVRVACALAATTLQYRVPCPTELPIASGSQPLCANECIGLAGGDAIFFLEVQGSESASGEVRHAIVEGRLVERAPPQPCFGAESVGVVKVSGRDLNLDDCPMLSANDQAQVQHGEGAHSGHLLVWWDDEGVRVVISVHRTATSDRDLLIRLASSIEMVSPQPPSS